MAYVTSASTLAQVQAAYDDAASYAMEANVTKAKEFIAACIVLLRRTPSTVMHTNEGGTEQVSYNPQTIQAEKTRAEQWLAAYQVQARQVKYPDFDLFRS